MGIHLALTDAVGPSADISLTNQHLADTTTMIAHNTNSRQCRGFDVTIIRIARRHTREGTPVCVCACVCGRGRVGRGRKAEAAAAAAPRTLPLPL